MCHNLFVAFFCIEILLKSLEDFDVLEFLRLLIDRDKIKLRYYLCSNLMESLSAVFLFGSDFRNDFDSKTQSNDLANCCC